MILASLARSVSLLPGLAFTIVVVTAEARRASGRITTVGWRSDLDRVKAVPDGSRATSASLLSSPVSAFIVFLVALRVLSTPVSGGPFIPTEEANFSAEPRLSVTVQALFRDSLSCCLIWPFIVRYSDLARDVAMPHVDGSLLTSLLSLHLLGLLIIHCFEHWCPHDPVRCGGTWLDLLMNRWPRRSRRHGQWIKENYKRNCVSLF